MEYKVINIFEYQTKIIWGNIRGLQSSHMALFHITPISISRRTKEKEELLRNKFRSWEKKGINTNLKVNCWLSNTQEKGRVHIEKMMKVKDFSRRTILSTIHPKYKKQLIMTSILQRKRIVKVNMVMMMNILLNSDIPQNTKNHLPHQTFSWIALFKTRNMTNRRNHYFQPQLQS